MNPDKHDGHDLDGLLKQVLRDDLPPETELKMRERLSAFRRAVESSQDLHAAPGAWLRGFGSVVEQWFSRLPVHPRKALAYMSAAMLAAGIAIHLGGYQSVLADSISLFNTSISIAGQIRLATSMECAITIPTAGAQIVNYHIRWVRGMGTRVDRESRSGIEETLWISQGHAAIGDFAQDSPGSTDKRDRGVPEIVREILSPADLASTMDEDWQVQPELNPRRLERLVFIDRQDRAVVEVHVDRRALLPISLSWRPPGAEGPGSVAATASFVWNRRVDSELMIPRRETGK